jgi:hypothetical protein
MFGTWWSTPGRRAAARRRPPLRLEYLEDRRVPATVGVDVTQVVRTVNDHVLGTNLAWWQEALNTPQTRQMVRDAGLRLLRLPGGSSSDVRHFNDPPPYQGFNTAPLLAGLIEAVGADGMVTVNYGTGSPQEGAAYLAYFNAQVGDPTLIGHGPQWSDASQSWVDQDWQTAGYWAGLRAAAPLAHDDGLNFLRANHPAPFGYTYYEVGNEEYANWETDHHTRPHDPVTYATFAHQFADLAHQIDPAVKVGVVTEFPLRYNLMPDPNWTNDLLDEAVRQGFRPGFLIDHLYATPISGSSYPTLSDDGLLRHSVNDPGYVEDQSPKSWAGRAAAYRAKLNQRFGDQAAGVELLLTEFNADLSSKQSVSLVDGLFVADAIGGLLQTEYNAGLFWDLRNGYTDAANNPNLYGWRTGNDNGMIGTGSGRAPATGTYVPYPAYFAEELVSQMVHGGDTVVQASGDDSYLTTYAVLQQNGHLDLLVINKNPNADLTGQFQLAGSPWMARISVTPSPPTR